MADPEENNGEGPSFGDNTPPGLLPSGRLLVVEDPDDPPAEEDDEFVADAGSDDEPRDERGRWTSGGSSAPISSIRTSQARSETNKEQVRHYRDQIKNKEPLTPLEVVLNKETGNYHLLDGHHRLYAAKAEGLTHVRVRVAHRAKSTRDTNEYIRAMRFG